MLLARRSDAAWWLFIAIYATALSLYVATTAGSHLVDDSFITLNYVRNLVEEGRWGLIRSETSNTATSPLNIITIAAANVASGDVFTAVRLQLLACAAAISLALETIRKRAAFSRWFTPFSLGLIFLNPLLQSTVGLETFLAIAVTVSATGAAMTNRAKLFGALSGLALMTRPDLFVFMLVLFLGHRQLWPYSSSIIALFLATCVPWYAWSWWQLGSLVPDTLLIKTEQGGWGPWSFANGWLLYLQKFPIPAFLSFAAPTAAIIGLVILAGRGGPSLIPGYRSAHSLFVLAAAAVAHYVSISLLQIPPYHWYYGPLIGALTVTLVGLSVNLSEANKTTSFRSLSSTGSLLSFLLLAGMVAYSAIRGGDSRAAPIMTNWALPSEYSVIGHALSQESARDVIESPGEIGTIAFYCDCKVVDVFSDIGATNELILRKLEAAGPVGGWLLSINYHFRDFGIPASRPTVRLVWSSRLPSEGAWAVTSPWRGPGWISRLMLQHADSEGNVD